MITGLLGIGIGIGLAMQTAVNSKLRKFVVSPYLASMVSFVIGTLFLAITMLIMGEPFGISINIFVNEPIWVWFGGFCGVIFLTVNILLFPKIGSVQTTVLPILGQIIMGMLIDHFGWFRSMKQPFDSHRVLGVILVLAGVLFTVALQDVLSKRGTNNIKVPTAPKSQANQWIWRLIGISAGMLLAVQFAINGELGYYFKFTSPSSLCFFLGWSHRLNCYSQSKRANIRRVKKHIQTERPLVDMDWRNSRWFICID